jgi:uncharacterized protein YgiM (DUF1202 family)
MERRRTNRRVVLKAAAGMAALSASGIGAVPGPARQATAQEASGTRAERFVPSENGIAVADAAAGEWVTFQAAYPFWALGASWDGSVGEWPILAIQFSADGTTWTETIDVAANTEDGGQPNRDERLFTPLVFTDGAQWVRYQTIDNQRRPGVVEGLSFIYIDPTDGPWADDITPTAVGSDESISTLTAETMAPPEIITREQWGANESWRFDTYGEIWPPEYETVTHLIVHHTATQNQPADVPNAIRAIYYYHAVEQGWGDIGYNYLVDHLGRIYQGRYGGQNVIGGHSYQFAIGSSGITTIGNFMTVEPTEAAKSALVSILAWVGRDLDPLGTADFHEAPDLPIISSHRDVNATTCPGDRLWNDLPELRQLVSQTLASGVLDTNFPAGIVPGDRVKVQTDDGSPLILRTTVGGAQAGTLAQGSLAWVIDGPTKTGTGNFYRLRSVSGSLVGWATAQYLIVDPPLPPGSPSTDYPFGLNVRALTDLNLRRGPDTSAGIITTVPTNTWAHILAGPEAADGWSWYQIRTSQYGDGWVISTGIAPAPINTSPPAKFAVGANVKVTQSSPIRPRPGVAQRSIATATAGSTMVISQAPVQVTGYIWYGVFSDAFGGGWIIEDVLAATTTPPPPSGKFQINDKFRVTSSTNLRATPSTSGSVITTMGTGTTGTVIGGPSSGGGYIWWNVRLSNGTTGWCIENWLVETDGGTTPPPSGKFQINDKFRVTETMNLRSSASTSASVVQSMPAGTTGTVIGGPTSANGYVWWNVRLTSGTTGWAVENWLVETDGGTTPPPPSGKFQINDKFRVTSSTNLRTSASTSASIVTTMSTGTTGTVIGGPTSANGYTWWNLRLSNGTTTGWSIENWLVETDGGTTPPPTGRFAIGDTVSVTESANFRTGAGTTNSVIRTLRAGETGTVKGGPTSASGYTWWQLTIGTTTGWVIDDVLQEGGGTTPPPSGSFPVGTTVQTNDPNVRLRSSASTSGTILYVLPEGARLTIVSGPTSGSGYSWYRVSSTTYGTGYIVQDFIERV